MFFFDDIDDTIFKLREQGNDYAEISYLLRKQGIKLQPFMIEERCKVIYERKNMKEPEDTIKQENKKLLLQELIFELREQGNSYKKIREYLLNEKGIEKSISVIRELYLKYCEEKKMVEPKKRISVGQNISSEEVFKLRESGYSYKDIVDYYKEKGIKISRESIYKLYIEECERVGKEYKSRVKLRKKCKDIIQLSEEEIFSLREKELTYDEIVEYFKEKGIKVTKETIRKRCKRIYAEKGKKEPRLKHKLNPEKASDRHKIPEEEIICLKEQGLSNQQILEYYTQKGLNLSISGIAQRCKEAYEKIGNGKAPRNRRLEITISEDELFELREKGLSYTKIAKHYKEKGIQVCRATIERRCKKIYKKRGMNSFRLKAGRLTAVTDEEIVELRKKRLTYREIAMYYKEKGVQVSEETIRKRYINACGKKQASLVELNNTLNNLLRKKQKTEQLLQQFTGALINIKNKKEDLENEK